MKTYEFLATKNMTNIFDNIFACKSRKKLEAAKNVGCWMSLSAYQVNESEEKKNNKNWQKLIWFFSFSLPNRVIRFSLYVHYVHSATLRILWKIPRYLEKKTIRKYFENDFSSVIVIFVREEICTHEKAIIRHVKVCCMWWTIIGQLASRKYLG